MSAKLPSPQPSQGDIRTACSEARQICMRSPPSLARIALSTMVLPAITSTMMPTTTLIATKMRTRSGRERQRPRSISTVRAAALDEGGGEAGARCREQQPAQQQQADRQHGHAKAGQRGDDAFLVVLVVAVGHVALATPAGEDQRHRRHHAHAAVAAERIAADERARHHAAARRRVVGADLLEVAADDSRSASSPASARRRPRPARRRR